MLLNVRWTSRLRPGVVLSLGAALLGAAPAIAQPAPQRITSDTPEYCLQLLDRVSEMARVSSNPPPVEVTSLSSEGQRMCDQGQTRAGILRLRRALVMMMRNGSEP